MKLIRYSLALWAMLTALQLYAQPYTLTGYIQDVEDRQALAGALVCDSCGNRCSSDPSGYFELKTQQPMGQVQVSLMGYHPQTLSYSESKRPIHIQLAMDSRSLTEVRVSGYGATEKTNRSITCKFPLKDRSCAASMPATICAIMASGCSCRGLSEVTTT